MAPGALGLWVEKSKYETSYFLYNGPKIKQGKVFLFFFAFM